MADVLDFMKKIDYENFVEDVTKYFDEAMAMYNLIGQLDIATITLSGVSDTDINIRYEVELSDNIAKDLDCIKNLVSALTNSTMTVYGNTYIIYITSNKNVLDITLVKKESL